MRKEIRTAVYDEDLHLEAYLFQGIVRPFPNHFHPYYVIGLVEAGERCLSCKGQEHVIQKGDVLLFNPGDNHACVQNGGEEWEYRCFHIATEVMLDLTESITGRRTPPGFSKNVIADEAAACCLRALHRRVMEGSREFGKEESLLLLVSMLIQRYGRPFDCHVPECGGALDTVCAFMEEHYAERITLDQLCRCAGLSRSTLLRAFTRTKGVTPYSYLENIRIIKAKQMLEQGAAPVEAALKTGFSDQSHFTNYFRRFIGLAPGVYRDIFFHAPRDLPHADTQRDTEGSTHEA